MQLIASRLSVMPALLACTAIACSILCVPWVSAQRIESVGNEQPPEGLSAAELIEWKLDQPTKLMLIKHPLSAVAVEIAKQHGLSIKLDESVLNDNKVSPSLPITLSLKNVKLRSALRLMLREHGLAYVVSDNRLMITSARMAETHVHQRELPIPTAFANDMDQVLAVIRSMLLVGENSDQWSVSIADDQIIVKTQHSVHQSVKMFLQQIEQAMNNPGEFVTTADSPAQRRIRDILRQPTELRFVYTDLSDAVRQVSLLHQLPIVINTRALDAAGISRETPITFDLKGVELGKTLRFMLHQADLSYVVRNEIVEVTTKQIADTHLTLRVYTVPAELVEQMPKVLEFAKQRGEEWTDQGGPCSAATLKNLLLVNAHHNMHEAVKTLVSRLQQRSKKARQ